MVLSVDLKLYIRSQESCRKRLGFVGNMEKRKKRGGSDSLLDVNAEIQDVTEMKRSCKMSSAQSLVFKLLQALDVSE